MDDASLYSNIAWWLIGDSPIKDSNGYEWIMIIPEG